LCGTAIVVIHSLSAYIVYAANKQKINTHFYDAMSTWNTEVFTCVQKHVRRHIHIWANRFYVHLELYKEFLLGKIW